MDAECMILKVHLALKSQLTNIALALFALPKFGEMFSPEVLD